MEKKDVNEDHSQRSMREDERVKNERNKREKKKNF